jgi:hypothetical protein
MKQGTNAFPSLTIEDSGKTPEWCKEVINAITAHLDRGDTLFNRSRFSDVENYAYYNGDINYDDFKYITEQYGMSYPARMVNYPIIQPKIDLLVGEEIKRPIDKKVTTVNKEAVLRKEDYKINLHLNKFLSEANQQITDMIGVDYEVGFQDMPAPQDIDKYMRYDYKEAVEEMAQDGLDFIIAKYDLKEQFKTGFRDFLITGKEFYKVYVKNGDPYVRRVDPRSFVYDVNSESDFIDSAHWAGEERWLTPNEILDEFRDELTEADLSIISEIQNMHDGRLLDYNESMDWLDWDSNSGMRVRVVHCEWKSVRPVRFKISENRYDPSQPFYKLVSPKYKAKKKDKIETKYIDDVWEGTCIGGKIYVKCQRRANQVRSVDDPGSTTLSYVGCIRNNVTGNSTSMVDVLKHIQMLYNIVMYHIELALARSGGKAVVYDVSQMPESLGMDMQKVMYHLKTDGIIPINSKEEGQQVQSFNQFQTIDFTLSNSVQQLINLKLMLEQTAGQISGVSPQREGAVSQYEYVGNVQRSVVQSATITENWFFQHNIVKKKCLEAAANLMKIAWHNGKKGGYVLGDGGFELISILPDIALNDYGVFIGDSGKDDAMKQVVAQLSQAALSSGQIQLLDVVRVLKADTMTEAEHILEQAMDEMRSMQAESSQQQAQISQMQQQAAEADFQREAKLKQMEVEGRVQVAKINAEAKIQAAEIDSDDKRDIADMREKVGIMKSNRDRRNA